MYQYEDGAAHSFMNVGREAMGYLTFLVEYYDCLPKVPAHQLLCVQHTQPGAWAANARYPSRLSHSCSRQTLLKNMATPRQACVRAPATL